MQNEIKPGMLVQLKWRNPDVGLVVAVDGLAVPGTHRLASVIWSGKSTPIPSALKYLVPVEEELDD